MRKLMAVSGWLTIAGTLTGCAAATGEIGGLVRRANGAPVPGAAVLIMQVPRDSVGGALVLVRADSCGRYHASHLAQGRYVVDPSGRSAAEAPADTVTLRAGDRTQLDRVVKANEPLAKAEYRHVRGCQ